MKRVKAVIGILLVLALGALGGTLLTGHVMKQRIRGYFQGPEPPLAVILRRMSHDLDLTADQREKIKPILETARTRMTALREKYRPEFQTVFDETTRDVKSILTEAQKPKLDRLQERMKHRKGQGGPPGPPPGPPPAEDMASLVRILNLTKTQIVEAQPLLARIVEHQKALQAALKKERQVFRANVSAVEKDWFQRRTPMDDQLAAILDAEQMTAYRQMMDTQRAIRPKGHFFE